MSKRAADFQLTNENFDLDERSLSGLINKENDKGEKEGDVLDSIEEIGARKMVRIRKRHDDPVNTGNVFASSVLEGNSNNEKSDNNNVKDSIFSHEQNKEFVEKPETNKEEVEVNNKKEEEEGEEAESSNKKEEREVEGSNNNKEEESKKEEILPFGNSGLSSSFKNPFISLAASSENSNFLFSDFSGNCKSSSMGGAFGSSGGDGISNLGGEEEVEEANEEPELESKAFTGEEHEDTVYQCKNVDLFMLKALESEEKSFRKLATGIIHLNVPKSKSLSELSETMDKKDDSLENEATVESNDQVSKSIQPRMIFRQKGIYKVLLNSPLNPEISKTFQKNSNIRKGYAVNFIAIGQESEIQQCMLRFQNESDFTDFNDKIHQIIDQHYSKTE